VTTSNGQQINVLNSNILKAYRVIALNKYDAKSFSDNVFLAYTMIEKDHAQAVNSNSHSGGNTGIKGNDLIKLTQMLCIDYPSEILNGILKMLDKKEEENVDFDEFLNAIKTIMLYDNYFEEMEVLFKYLDTKKTGKIKKNDLVDAVAKLRKSIDKTNAEDGKPKCDLRVPSEDDLDHVYSSMIVEEEGALNWDEYLITLFKVTLESSD
jgi:Ca2+-binding EF-hand superfamily protein